MRTIAIVGMLVLCSVVSAQSGTWVQETAGAPWSARNAHEVVVFNNRIWVIGGWDSGGYKNDVWSSADGVNWQLETAAAQFPPRAQFAAAVYNNRIWVTGGWDGTRRQDVWSSADGINWTQEATPGWTGRNGHYAMVFNNRLYVVAGLDATSGRRNDVWYTTTGTTWTQDNGAAAFTGQSHGAGTVYDSRMWICGGLTSNNQVWYSTNGPTWTQATAAAAWTARYAHRVIAYNSRLFVMGGRTSAVVNDVWTSANGSSWTQLANASWAAREYYATTVFNGKLWVLGGTGSTRFNDVWSYTEGPVVSPSVSSLNLGTTYVNTPGTQYNYTVQGYSTTGQTTVTAPANVQIKLSTSATWVSSFNIANTGNWGPFTINVRIASTASPATISGNITHGGFGGTTVNVSVTGSVTTPPSLSVNPSSLNLGTTPQGTAGSILSYAINGTATTAATDITAPAGVELSFNQTTWSPTLQIGSTGTWPNTTVYVRIAASATAGAISGNITNATTGATTQNVAVTGNVTPPPTLLATPDTLNLGSTGQGVPGSEHSYVLDGTSLVSSTVITAPAGVEISQTSGSGYSGTTTITTTPSFSVTIYVRLTGATVGAVGGTITNVSGTASEDVTITGTVTPNLNLVFTRNGPAASTGVDNNAQGAGGLGLVILDFSVSTGTDAFTLTDITFSESGTADGQADINFLALYLDDGSGSFDAADTLATAAAGTSFNAPNGSYTATLSNSAFPASTTRRFFLVCKLAGTAGAGETIQAEITAVTSATGGTGTTIGVPTSGAGPALTINPATLTATLHGPLAYTTVNADSQGPGGNGHVICDVTLTAANDSWTVSSLTFSASGTADEQADISSLALYLDNGNGAIRRPRHGHPGHRAAGAGFSAPDGSYTATLTAAASAFAMNGSKRFFLVAKLAGSAGTAETFRAALTGVAESSPSGGTVQGVPTAASSALVIDVATLTVNAGPANPANTHVMASGSAFNHTLGQLRLTASNADFTLSGIVLTLGGNGDWVNNISSLGVYLDDGNGSFDGADTQLFSGAAGAGSISCGFSANLTVGQATSEDLWVVIAVASTAGGSPSESFDARIQSTTDVQTVTAGNVALGTNPPVSGMLHVITYSVTGFTPLQDSFSGGKPITITGSGFALPVTVTIGGVICTGTASVDATGTQITGLFVPGGSGSSLPITLDTNNLGPQTLSQTFSYTLSIGVGGGGGGGGGGGCANTGSNTGSNTAILLLAALALTATATTLRRKRA
ncbi:MAG: hypothetical protein M5U25_20455 [Planctomycetota bacterium]|nr:hypothetical protein [Planctomycetota bacterium]